MEILFWIRHIGSFIIALILGIMICVNTGISPFSNFITFIGCIFVFIIFKSIGEFIMDVIFFNAFK